MAPYNTAIKGLTEKLQGTFDTSVAKTIPRQPSSPPNNGLHCQGFKENETGLESLSASYGKGC